MKRWLCRLWRHRYVAVCGDRHSWFCVRCGRSDRRWAPDVKAAAEMYDFGILG